MARRSYIQEYPPANLWDQINWSTKLILIILIGMILVFCLLVVVRFGFIPSQRNFVSSRDGTQIFPTPIPGAPALTGNITVNVFSGPGLNHEVIGQLNEGRPAQVVGISSDRQWWVVMAPSYDGGLGWIEATSVNTSNAESVPVIEYSGNMNMEQSSQSQVMYIVANEDIEILNGPGEGNTSLGILLAGKTSEVVGKSSDDAWWIIKIPFVDGGQGWVPVNSVSILNAEDAPKIEVSAEPEAGLGLSENLPVVEAVANVNIRSGPDLQYETVGLLQLGDVAEVVGLSNDRLWWAIKVPFVSSGQGWVSADYVDPRNTEDVQMIDPQEISAQTNIPSPESGAPTLTAITRVNVRSGPGEEFQILGMLEADQKAEIISITSDGSWWGIKLPSAQNGVGWVSARFSLAENAEGVEVVK